jgi:hypothetical protein
LKKNAIMVSKFATLLLAIHTIVSLYLTTSLQHFDANRPDGYVPGARLLFHASIYASFVPIPFLLLTFLNYCCIPRSWRISFKRHLFIVLVFAPILAQVVGRAMGWIESTGSSEVEFSAACYDQLDAQDLNVLAKGVYCEYKHGISRGEAERRIGKRRQWMEFVEHLARVCNEGLRDMDHWTGHESLCWMGHGGGGGERVGEGRNSEREWMRRGFEECHARFRL